MQICKFFDPLLCSEVNISKNVPEYALDHRALQSIIIGKFILTLTKTFISCLNFVVFITLKKQLYNKPN